MTEKSSYHNRDRLIPAIAFVVTGLVFLPVVLWLLRQTARHEQLFHALLVLAFTGFLLIMQRRISLRPVFLFNDISMYLLLAGYALLIVAVWSGFAVFTLTAFSLSLGAFLLFVFGLENRRFLLSSMAAFAIFTTMAAYLPVLDWPLRSLAGKWSAAGLSLIGQQAELGLYHGSDSPMLLLFNEGRPFHVAAECNGFGLLTSSLLMGTVLLLYRRIGWADRLLFLGAALVLGFVFNTLRIIVIVLLAPLVGDDGYMIMHEIVGLAATYGGLALIYFIIMPAAATGNPGSSPEPSSAASVH